MENGIYFRKIIRYDVDAVLSYARSLQQFKEGLEEIGYVVNLTGKHWTLKHPQSKRAFRFYKLSRDNRYDEEHLMERINNNYLFPMQQVADIVPCKEYPHDYTKLKGIKVLYFKYCYALGIIRPKETKQHYPSPQLRKDLIYMDKITSENTFVGKHNLETIEDVLAFKHSVEKLITQWSNQRRSIYNKIKRTHDPERKQQLIQDKDILTSKIAHGKKKIKGKTNLDNMLKSGKELKVFAIHHSDLEKFCTEAKHYGVLYSVLKEKNNKDGIVDIMVRAEDASKISRMVDKFDLATIDTKVIRESVLSQNKDVQPLTDEQHDALINELMQNPEQARMSKDGTSFEPSSKTLKKENKKKTVAKRRSTATTDRPSVRKELQSIKQEKLKSATPKMPVKKKSKKKVR